MRRLIQCPQCGLVINQNLPDVSVAEAERLKAGLHDERVIVQCPDCEHKFILLKWDLPELPEPQN